MSIDHISVSTNPASPFTIFPGPGSLQTRCEIMEQDENGLLKRRKLDCDEEGLVQNHQDTEVQSTASSPVYQDAGSHIPDDSVAWTLESLMRRFQSSEEIQEYLERNHDVGLLRLLRNMQEVGAREKLSHVNSLDDVCQLLRASRKILVLTGAGVSVSAGIPDFRSADGIYARLKREFMMPSPTCMFDIKYFNENPGPFFDFASELWPGRFKPSQSHLFIAELERRGKLLRNYTQNIDTLEHQAGSTILVGSIRIEGVLKLVYAIQESNESSLAMGASRPQPALLARSKWTDQSWPLISWKSV